MSTNKSISAIAFFDTKTIKGIVRFVENIKDNSVDIYINIQGLKKNAKHGFHIHEYGDMSDKCDGMCAHFNPFNKNHGGPDDTDRHLGDLGNLESNDQGYAQYKITDNHIHR